MSAEENAVETRTCDICDQRLPKKMVEKCSNCPEPSSFLEKLLSPELFNAPTHVCYPCINDERVPAESDEVLRPGEQGEWLQVVDWECPECGRKNRALAQPHRPDPFE